MNSKKYLAKYGCCAVIYIIFCFVLIVTRIIYISNLTWKKECKDLTESNLIISTTVKLANNADEILTLIKSQRNDEQLPTLIDPQVSERF